MSSTLPHDDSSLSLLQQFFSTATYHASAALCHWTRGQVTLAYDELVVSPLGDAMEQFGEEMGVVAMVVLGIEGSGGTRLILVFDEENGRKLAGTLLRREPNSEAEWSELEQSALMETGNILASAYLNELTRLVGRQLVPSAPMFLQDFGASVLEQALMMQAMDSDEVMISRTRFEFDAKKVNWSMLLLPDDELREALGGAIAAPNEAVAPCEAAPCQATRG